MSVQLLISTINEGINKLEFMLMPPVEGVTYLISHQCLKEEFKIIPEALKRNDVRLIQIISTGLSVNRNNCLMHADGDILMILDDDIIIKPEYISKLRGLFSSDNVDIACCKIKTYNDEPEYKSYSKKEINLKKISQLKAVSSIEISIRNKSFKSKDIWFDERFGLGTRAQSGEELIFLNDCLKKGLKIKFFPEYTIEHPFNSSAKNISPYSDSRLFTSGAQAFALYKNLAYLRNFIAVIRRFSAIRKSKISIIHFLKMKNEGINYLRSFDSKISSRHKYPNL